MRTTDQIISFLRTHKFSEVRAAVLDRTKAKSNRAEAKAFSARTEALLKEFQDSDVILIALKVKHDR